MQLSELPGIDKAVLWRDLTYSETAWSIGAIKRGEAHIPGKKSENSNKAVFCSAHVPHHSSFWTKWSLCSLSLQIWSNLSKIFISVIEIACVCLFSSNAWVHLKGRHWELQSCSKACHTCGIIPKWWSCYQGMKHLSRTQSLTKAAILAQCSTSTNAISKFVKRCLILKEKKLQSLHETSWEITTNTQCPS